MSVTVLDYEILIKETTGEDSEVTISLNGDFDDDVVIQFNDEDVVAAAAHIEADTPFTALMIGNTVFFSPSILTIPNLHIYGLWHKHMFRGSGTIPAFNLANGVTPLERYGRHSVVEVNTQRLIRNLNTVFEETAGTTVSSTLNDANNSDDLTFLRSIVIIFAIVRSFTECLPGKVSDAEAEKLPIFNSGSIYETVGNPFSNHGIDFIKRWFELAEEAAQKDAHEPLFS